MQKTSTAIDSTAELRIERKRQKMKIGLGGTAIETKFFNRDHRRSSFSINANTTVFEFNEWIELKGTY